MPSDSLRQFCRLAIQRYLQLFPEEKPRLESLESLLRQEIDLADRRSLPGHATASGILHDRTTDQFLLVHHRGLNRWLQPGGHVDAGEFLSDAARREVREETGCRAGRLLSLSPDAVIPIDVDSHFIPANPRKGEAAHTHHDFRFAFEVDRRAHEIALATDEVHAAAWIGVADPRFPEDLHRVVKKLGACQLFPID